MRAVAFSPDGRQLASGAADASVKLWDVTTGAETRALRGHADSVNSVAFSPDGRWLSTGGEDAATRIWESATGELQATLVTMTDTADWLVVTPDGLFDGSPPAWNQILWRFAGDTRAVAPVEVFFNEFFYPDLLSDILAGKRPRAARDIAGIDRRQPVIKMSLAGAGGGDDGERRDIFTHRLRQDRRDGRARRGARPAPVPQRLARACLARRRAQGAKPARPSKPRCPSSRARTT